MFTVFINFLQTNNLRHPNLRATTLSKHFFRFLAELFTFAKEFEATSMRNAVIDKLFLRIFAQPNRLSFENIHKLYDNSSEGSALRDLVINIILNIGTNGLVEIYSDEVPRKFLVDLLKMTESDGIAPFSHKQQWKMEPWLESKRGGFAGSIISMTKRT
jgi:hypothetical protein